MKILTAHSRVLEGGGGPTGSGTHPPARQLNEIGYTLDSVDAVCRAVRSGALGRPFHLAEKPHPAVVNADCNAPVTNVRVAKERIRDVVRDVEIGMMLF